MPGKVIAGHAKYENNCNECHDVANKSKQNELCLDCHKLVNKDRKKRLSMNEFLTEPHGFITLPFKSQIGFFFIRDIPCLSVVNLLLSFYP